MKSLFTILTTITHLRKTNKGEKKVPIGGADCRLDPSGGGGPSRPFLECPFLYKKKKKEIQL